MDIWKVFKTVGRRWYVSLMVLALCSAATASLVARAQATYMSSASIALLPPTLKQVVDTKVATQSNPFIESGIPFTAKAVTSASNSDLIANKLKAAGLGDVTFEVNNGGQDNSTILYMSVESTSAAETRAAIKVVLDGVQSITGDLQAEAKAPADQLITAQVLAPSPNDPIESLASKTKVAMGLAIASLLVVLCSALLFDNIAVRRRSKRRVNAEVLPHEGHEWLGPHDDVVETVSRDNSDSKSRGLGERVPIKSGS